jgi:hydroxyacylglutathione hydrolase
MLLRYFYHQKLAHASYMIGCQATGEAIVIDPGRDVEMYLHEVKQQNMRLIAVAETHIHADYVSGVCELGERTGATLYLSDEGDENWKYQYFDRFDHVLLKDGTTFKVGNIQFEALHTPGHTPEHISFLVTDTAGANLPMGIFTGDFVFVGDVGRPDLLEKAANIAGTAEVGARQLFSSLQRFKDLPDYLQVWPAHGAGSACGKALGAIPSTTVGYEKLFNIALSYTDEEKFVKAILEGQPQPPKYFAVMKRVNKEGPQLLSRLPSPNQLSFDRLAELVTSGATVVDVRRPAAFAQAHIPGTINIPYDSWFPNGAGWVLDYDRPFYLIADSPLIEEIRQDLLYVGLDNVTGYFPSSVLETWSETGQPLQSYEVTISRKISEQILKGEVTLLDVRNDDEWEISHIPGAQHIGLGYLAERIREVPSEKPIVVLCGSGGRSAIGASILQAKGITTVMNLMGGIDDWMARGLPVEYNGT